MRNTRETGTKKTPVTPFIYLHVFILKKHETLIRFLFP